MIARIESLDKATEDNRAAVRTALALASKVKNVETSLASLEEALTNVSGGLESARRELAKARTDLAQAKSDLTQLVKKSLDEREATIRTTITKAIGEATARMDAMIQKEAAERTKDITDLRKLVTKAHGLDRDTLDGSWKLVGVKTKGVDVQKDVIEKAGVKLQVLGSKAVFETGDSKTAMGIFQASDTKTAALEMNFGAEKIPFLPARTGKVNGAYQVERNMLKILIPDSGRPVGFDLKRYPEATLLTFERIPNP